MSITSFLNSRGFYSFEGYSQQVPEQVKDLIKLTDNPNISVMEIGFNAGHSAEVFLQNNKYLTLTSFDLGAHNYVITAKDILMHLLIPLPKGILGKVSEQKLNRRSASRRYPTGHCILSNQSLSRMRGSESPPHYR